MVRAIEDVTYQHHYSLVLCNSDEDPAKEAFYIDLMVAEKVAGVILSPTNETDASCKRLAEIGIPVVAIDRRTRQADVDTVVVDNAGAACATQPSDRRRTSSNWAIVGPPGATTGMERRAGYLRALRNHQIDVEDDLVHIGPPTVDYGYQMVNQLMALDKPPSAIFLGNNLLTIGALRLIHERKLRIPEDIAIGAFDEMDLAFVMNPALTVVSQPVYEMGNTVADLLLARISDYSRPTCEVMLQPTIKIRQSCACHDVQAVGTTQSV